MSEWLRDRVLEAQTREDEARDLAAWRLYVPAGAFADLFVRELEAAHAAMDVRERDLDAHEYGGPGRDR